MIVEFKSCEESPKAVYDKLETRKVFIGCIIKSSYDEERINISEKFNPKRIYHCGKHLYGCLIEPNKKDSFFLKYLIDSRSLDLFSYDKLIKENEMSCDENFAYFESNLYPVDTSHIYKYIADFSYESFFVENLEMPLYQRIKGVNMFFLTPE